MASSDVDICNAALIKIGHTAFISALTDTTAEGVVSSRIYADTRDEVLADFRWPFATRRTSPAPLGGTEYAASTTYASQETVSYNDEVYVSLQGTNLGNTPDESPAWWRKVSRGGWTYIFAYPSDCITLRGIYAGTRAPRREEEVPCDRESDETLGQLILTDEDEPEFLYTARIEAVGQYSSLFVDALAWKLASKLAGALRKDLKLVSAMLAGYDLALGKAWAHAERERTRDVEPDPSHIAARG